MPLAGCMVGANPVRNWPLSYSAALHNKPSFIIRLLLHPLKFILTISFQCLNLFQWMSMKCSSLVLLTSHVKFQVYSRLKLTQRCSSPAGLVSNLNLLKFMSWNKHPRYLLRALPWICAKPPLQGSKGGTVLTSLASHQCGLASTPVIDAIIELIFAGSLPCFERFFSGYSGFPLFSKTNTSKFQFDLECTDTFKRVHMNSYVLHG